MNANIELYISATFYACMSERIGAGEKSVAALFSAFSGWLAAILSRLP